MFCLYFGRCFFGALDCFSSDICFLIVGCCKSLRFFSFGSLSLLHFFGAWEMVKEKVNKVNLILTSYIPRFRDSEQIEKLRFTCFSNFSEWRIVLFCSCKIQISSLYTKQNIWIFVSMAQIISYYCIIFICYTVEV